MIEERRTERKRAFVGGQIQFDDRGPAVFCLVRNFSEQGARLDLVGAGAAPAAFALQINGKDVPYRAEVVWRRGASIGVSLRRAPAAPLPQPM